jgi:hypothetical protein
MATTMTPEYRDPTRSSPLPPLPAATFARLQAAIAAEPPVSRARERLRRASFAVLPLLVLAALAGDASVRGRSLVRADASGLGRLWLPSVLGALALALVMTVLALARGRDSLGLRVALLRAGAVLAAPLSTLPMVALASAAGRAPDAHHPWGLPCFALASAVAIGALAWLVAGLRHTVVVAVGWRSAVLGSAASAWSALALLLHCTSRDAVHLALGHALPLVLFPVVAVALRRELQL